MKKTLISFITILGLLAANTAQGADGLVIKSNDNQITVMSNQWTTFTFKVDNTDMTDYSRIIVHLQLEGSASGAPATWYDALEIEFYKSNAWTSAKRYNVVELFTNPSATSNHIELTWTLPKIATLAEPFSFQDAFGDWEKDRELHFRIRSINATTPNKPLTLSMWLTWQYDLDGCGRYLEEKSNAAQTTFRLVAPPVNFPTATPITYGDRLSTSTLTGGTTGRGTFTWINGGIVPPVSNPGYTVIFTPLDKNDYYYSSHIPGWDPVSETVRRIVPITVNKANPQPTHLAFDVKNFIYDATSHGIPVVPRAGYTELGAITMIYEGTGSTDYPPSADEPVNAGDYTATAYIAESANYNAAVIPITPFTIARAVPTIDVLTLDTDTFTHYTDEPQGIVTPTLKAPYTGLGEVTVKYNGNARRPVYPGTYAITIDIDEGTNYFAVKDLPLGTYTITEAPTPIVQRFVKLIVSPHYESLPMAGHFYVMSGRDLTIFLTSLPTLPGGYVPKVTTDRAIIPDDEHGVTVTHNGNGGYTILIAYIQQDITITIDAVPPVANDAVAAAATRVWSHGGRLHVAAGASEGRACIYNVMGSLVKILPYAAGGTVSTTLPAGIYIVTAGGRKEKITIGYQQ
jgi:hypothetical protein